MKTIFIAILLPSFLLTGYSNANWINPGKELNQNSLFQNTPSSVNQVSEKSDVSENWKSSILQSIINEEYNITYSDEHSAYQSPNRVNNIRFIYHKDGFTAMTRDNRIPLFDVNDKTLSEEEKKYKTIDEWSVDVRLSEVTRDARREMQDARSLMSEVKCQMSDECNVAQFDLSILGSEFIVDKNKAYIENENIRIDYTNSKDGMRQDFIVTQRAEGDGNLRLILSADTELKMSVNENEVTFTDIEGENKMKYSSLKCWDANGQEMYAYFEADQQLRVTSYELRDKSKIKNQKSKISIVVDDKDAVYPITIDPLSASPTWFAESNQADAELGFSVSGAGDVNNDGFDDVIVGAYLYNNGHHDEGKAYIYAGSPTGLSASPLWSRESNFTDAHYGYSVSGAGDVNNDGFDDVIVGAPWQSNTPEQPQEGRIFVYHGSASGPGDANMLYQNNKSYSHLGTSVSGAGDVNNDGFDDVIVGVPGFQGGTGIQSGAIYIFHGSATGLSTVPNFTKPASDFRNSEFGSCVSDAGDVNGDGYSDVFVGDWDYSSPTNGDGAVYCYRGSSTGILSSPLDVVYGGQPDARFGWSISSADVNGDARSDLIVGAPMFDNGYYDKGKVFVYHSTGGTFPNTPNWSYELNQNDARLGISVSSAGDVNADGYDEIIVGANLYDNGNINEGAAFIFAGSSTGLASTFFWTVEGQQDGGNVGISVSDAGDVDGNDYGDIIVGADKYDNGEVNEGMAFAYYSNGLDISLTPNWQMDNIQASAQFGNSISSAGDINGDGYDDIIVGAEFYDHGQVDEGGVFIYMGGGTGLNLPAHCFFESDQDSAHMGDDVSSAGDVNGDGFDDVIMGAKFYTNGENREGKVFLWYGPSSAAFIGNPSNANWSFECNSIGAFLGHSVSSAGDINGDGYGDVIVSANNFSGGEANEGRVFLFYGSPSGLSLVPDWTAECNQADALFGAKVSCAGDVNGDGYDEVIIGANLYDNGQSNEGGIFVWMGSATGPGLGFPDWTAETNQAGSRMGTSCTSAGDVNGDGYGDIIAGARLYDNTETNEGGAFVWYGSNTGLSAPGTPVNADWSAFGGQANSSFGYAAISAGDNNGDGYSDVVIGAYTYDVYFPDEGAAFVYFGSGSGLGLGQTGSPLNADRTMYVNQTDAQFGYSLASCDINGNSNGDILVSAHLYDDPDADMGKVFAYYGTGGSPVQTLELGVSPEGLYNSATNSIIRDTVRVYIRQSSAPFPVVDSAKTFLRSNLTGSMTFTHLTISNGTPYYLEVVHRNSIQIWSKNPVTFTGNNLSYKFTDVITKAFGNNMVQIDAAPVTFAIYGGDVNQNGTVDAQDISAIDNDAFNFVSGYVNSDLTGNNVTDAPDLAIADNNAFNFVAKITPP